MYWQGVLKGVGLYFWLLWWPAPDRERDAISPRRGVLAEVMAEKCAVCCSINLIIPRINRLWRTLALLLLKPIFRSHFGIAVSPLVAIGLWFVYRWCRLVTNSCFINNFVLTNTKPSRFIAGQNVTQASVYPVVKLKSHKMLSCFLSTNLFW